MHEAQMLRRGVSLLACCGKRTQERHNKREKCAKRRGPISGSHGALPGWLYCLLMRANAKKSTFTLTHQIVQVKKRINVPQRHPGHKGRALQTHPERRDTG